MRFRLRKFLFICFLFIFSLRINFVFNKFEIINILIIFLRNLIQLFLLFWLILNKLSRFFLKNVINLVFFYSVRCCLSVLI